MVRAYLTLTLLGACAAGVAFAQGTARQQMDFFYDLLKKSKARQTLLIVQACQDDPFARNDFAAERLEFAEKSDEVPEGIAAIFSCMEGQKSYYDPARKRGLFFDHVIRSWNGEYPEAGEKLDLEEFFRQVRVKTKADALKFRGGVPQVPEVRRDYKGQWLVATGRARPALPKQVDADLGDGVKLTLMYIPPGKFQMGSPATEANHASDELQHEVEITKGFYLGKHEVTQEQYQAVMGEDPSRIKGAKLPVERVSWEDAQTFCRKLSAKTGQRYRLPSEAEWEYACRAGTKTPFSFGETITPEQVNYDGNYAYGGGAKGVYREKTTQVGSFAANAFGLHDMHGNVWEWCEDWYDEKYYSSSPIRDPLNTEKGSARVMRGGSWHYYAGDCRSANRNADAPSNRSNDLGFRVARSSVE